MAKIGSAFAAFVVDLGGKEDPGSIKVNLFPFLSKWSLGIPPLVFGIMMAVSSVVFFFLPETKGKSLPQTVGDVKENYRELQRPCCGPVEWNSNHKNWVLCLEVGKNCCNETVCVRLDK